MLKRLSCFRRLLRDESGNVQSTEYILMIVLLAIGGIVGLATLRDQVAQELADTAVALEQLDQSYTVTVPSCAVGGTTTSAFSDTVLADTAAGADPVGTAPFGMTFVAPSGELAMPAMPATSNEGK